MRDNFVDIDPRLLAPACLYLACKVEESQVQAKLIIVYTRQAQGGCPSKGPDHAAREDSSKAAKQ